MTGISSLSTLSRLGVAAWRNVQRVVFRLPSRQSIFNVEPRDLTLDTGMVAGILLRRKEFGMVERTDQDAYVVLNCFVCIPHR
jgi:hypothetical protein